MTHESTLMTVGEAARYLQLHRNGMRKLARQKSIPHRQTVGGQLLFRFGDIKALGLERAASRMSPAQRQARVRRPEGQIGLPLTIAAQAPPKPRSWWLAKFTPRMVKVGLKGEASGVRSHTEPRPTERRSHRVA